MAGRHRRQAGRCADQSKTREHDRPRGVIDLRLIGAHRIRPLNVRRAMALGHLARPPWVTATMRPSGSTSTLDSPYHIPSARSRPQEGSRGRPKPGVACDSFRQVSAVFPYFAPVSLRVYVREAWRLHRLPRGTGLARLEGLRGAIHPGAGWHAPSLTASNLLGAD